MSKAKTTSQNCFNIIFGNKLKNDLKHFRIQSDNYNTHLGDDNENVFLLMLLTLLLYVIY